MKPPLLCDRFDKLRPGMKAKVAGYSSEMQGWERLMEMGLVPGQEFEVMREAPLGGCLEICVLGSSLCLRKCEGKCILIEPVED